MSWGRHQRNRKKTLKADLKKKQAFQQFHHIADLIFLQFYLLIFKKEQNSFTQLLECQKIVLCPDFKGRWKLKTKTIKTELQILKQLIVKVRQYHRRVVWKEVQKRLIKCDQSLFFLAYWDLTIDHFTAPGCHCDLMSSDIQIFEC